jgi:hypothetical protein
MDEGATIGADPPSHDPWDRDARIARMAAGMTGDQGDPGDPGGDFEANGGFVPAEDAGEFDEASDYVQGHEEFEQAADYGEPDEYDVAAADVASFEEYQRVVKAAEIARFNDDVLREARKHGLEPPTPDDLKNIYYGLSESPDFGPERVERFMERVAHEDKLAAQEHEQRLLAIRHGNRDPLTGEFPSWQEQQAAKDEWYRLWAKRNGLG